MARANTQVPGLTSAGLRVEEVMHAGVLTCDRDESLLAVARLMARHRIHAVVVTGGDSLWGVISDLDLVAAASVRDLRDQTAESAAASAALTIASGETLQRAIQLMLEHGVSHLVAVDSAEGRPVGVLSTLDVARALADRADT
jgi:CBS domain-containing protein